MKTTFTYTTLTVDASGQPQTSDQNTTEGWVEPLGALELVAIPAGQFCMGAPKTEEGWHPTQSPQHQVTIAPFYLSCSPISQAQWQAVTVLPTINRSLQPQPSCFRGDDRPVEQVSWYDAVEFCDRLTAHTGRTYRLPSEAEWEYACRAHTHTPFHFGETLTTDIANYSGVDWEYQGKICTRGSYGAGPTGSDRRETTMIGQFQVANAFGLFDMHGLVREWCQDCWQDSYIHASDHGHAAVEGNCELRIVRGGSWNTSPRACRSAFRHRLPIDTCLYDVGFRVACDPFPLS